MTSTLTDAPASPYKGLASYTEQDAALFFGRDREREVVIANLKARELTVLYGESGVGKSSLLRAGVMSDLLEAARGNLADLGTPEHLPVIFSAWRDEPIAGLIAAIRAAVREIAGVTDDPPDTGSLAAVIDWAVHATDGYVLLILDQFEEYFLYHPAEQGPGAFAAEFPAILNRPGVQANLLVSIREDALAKLDRFKRDIPRMFESSLRVEHLDAEAASEAIRRPVDHYNALVGPHEQVALEDGLVAAVIDQVRSGRVVLEQAGRGTLGSGDGADRIETPFLQLVMARLWDVEQARGSRTLRVSTLSELGGAQEIIRTHLDAALRGLDASERDTLAALFHQLVTPSGTKIAHAVPDLAEYARRPEAEVRGLLEKLARPETRIVRPVPPPPGEEGPERFEIFHDVLAPSVLAWRTRHMAAKRIEEQRRAARAAIRRRARRLVLIVAGIGFAAVAVLAIIAYSQRNEAKEQATRAGEQAKLARELALFDPNVRNEYMYFPSRGPFLKFVTVEADRGSLVTAECVPRGCAPFRWTADGGAARQNVRIRTLADRTLPPGVTARVVVTKGNIGKVAEYRAGRRLIRRVRFQRCRPPGSLVPAADVPLACP